MIKSSTDISVATLQRMIFIYNAIMAGWNIKKINNHELIFTRNSESTTINIENFLTSNLPLDLENLPK